MINGNLLAMASGVIAHVFIFRIGEWNVEAPAIFIVHAMIALLASIIQPHGSSFKVPEMMISYLVGLYTSMLVYRGFFHRLSSYPGPLLAKFSNFYITGLSIRKLHLFEEVQKLHMQYGDYVRLGPSEISIAAPEAVNALYGSQSPTTKGPWYTLLEPRTPLFMERDKQKHARRRKIWDRGFTTKALQGYETRISKAIDQLLHVIEQNIGQPINITQWFTFFVFDVMEDLAFNKSSNMLRHGREAYVFRTIRADMYSIAFFTHLPWLLPFLKRIPLLNWNYLHFWNWIQSQIDERKENEPDQPDILSWILEAFESGPKTRTDRWNLHGDAQLIVIAGGDSTAAALTHVFFHLAYDTELVRALQEELDALPDLAHDNLVKVALLDAVINETMRLHPPVPSGTQRVTPPEGLQIGDHYVPGNVIVQVPSYTVCRDPRAFERPLEFLPERWMSRSDLIKDRSVFIPFNQGPYACVGKRLALLEIRRAVSEILWRYDVRIKPGYRKEAFLDASQDTFTLVSGPLPVIFERRTSKQ